MRTAGVAFLFSMAVAAALTPAVRLFALKRGLLDHAISARKIHGKPIPRLGGLAIVAGFYAPIAALLVYRTGLGFTLFADRARIAGLLAGGLAIAGLGLVDDLRGLGAPLKLLVQLSVSLVLYQLGFRIEHLATPWGAPVALGVLSLGGSLHSFVVENGFDLEVLDRDTLGLTDLPYPLDYLNVRILQCHDIWHMVADHKTSGLHEVSVSGFQMAQFGHQYSSMFLGMVLAKVAFTAPDAFAFTLDTILTGYRHGRQTPPLLGVEWETLWDRPIPDIRQTLGVTAYESPYPAWILEEMKGVPARTA